MTQVGKMYGGALYELCRDEGLEKDILSQMKTVSSILSGNPEFVKLLRQPSVPKAERVRILDECFGGSVHGYLLNFMKILVENGTAGEFSECFEAYRARYNEDNDIIDAFATVAVPLDKAEEQKLCGKLSEITGKSVVLTVVVDPSVMGGVRVTMDGVCYDGTVSARLDAIGASLANMVL